MNLKIVLITSVAAANMLFCGCASNEQARPKSVVNQRLVMIPLDQVDLYAAREASCLGDQRTADVELPGKYRAVVVNRIQEGNLMHETHVVYKREAAASWNLKPAQGVAVPTYGRSFEESRAEIQPVKDQEVLSLLKAQQRTIGEQREVIRAAAQTLSEIAKQQRDLAGAVIELQQKSQAAPKPTPEKSAAPGASTPAAADAPAK